jgi:tetratricopeptide (TPR) repeat protein
VIGEPGPASAEWQQAIARARDNDSSQRRRAATPPQPWEPEVWVEVDTDVAFDDETPAPSASAVVSRTRTPRRETQQGLPREVVDELKGATGERRAPGVQKKLAEAARAYDADRYADAARLLRPLAEAVPSAPAVRELYGLTLYRLGRWKPALKELEASRQLSGSVDQYPVIADCLRALGRHKAVDAIWDDLRHASPSAEVMTEGRIVVAGSLADRGDIAGAIALLERTGVDRARPRDHHLRSWYALADLYERGGDVPRARELFRRIMALDADFHDVVERLAAL